MLLTSPAFKHSEPIPRKFTCEGGDINPELTVQNLPQGVKSLALLMDDPDARLPDALSRQAIGGQAPGGTFTHWLVWNIDPAAAFIKEESKPPRSVEGVNSGATVGYMGPCPPPGKPHRYFFKAYALDAMLPLTTGATRQEFEAALAGHVLGTAELMGTYER
jgi:Raf kinase inhibitor-like YbhB/YbcL family protein